MTTGRPTRASGTRRLGRTIAGGTLVAAGLALLVLPGPGLLLLAGGTSILAVDYPWARRVMRRVIPHRLMSGRTPQTPRDGSAEVESRRSGP